MANSILGRISTLMKANVNAMLDKAEDPEKMLDQMIRDFTNNIAEAETAVATTVGNLRLLEDDLKEAREASGEWGNKALAASQKADEMRTAGKTVDADRFDNLAKTALKRQMGFEEQVKTFSGQVEQQTVLTDKLKNGLNGMRQKREELVQKRDELVARAKMASASIKVQEAVKSISVVDPTSDLGRFEERIRRQEALARGMEEVSADSIEEQFDLLDDDMDDLEVEARLAALKSGSTPQLASGS
jgi:phage shock protein A